MTTQHETDAVARYAAAVRVAVADLGPEERAQLLGDLEAHLEEVAAEGGGSLAERLGPPEAYAAELRAAYGAAPPRSSRRPVDARPRWRRRRTLAIGVVLLVAVAGAVALDVWSASDHPGGDAWSVSRLQNEAAAGHVTQMEFRGNGSGIATDRSGTQHLVKVPDATSDLAGTLVRDNVDVAYVQQSNGPVLPLHVFWALALLLYLGVPAVVVLLVIGVLWRLYRRLGRPAAS